MAEDFSIPDLDGLFDEESDHEPIEEEQINYLFIGRKKLFDKIKPIVTSFANVNFQYTSSIDQAIDLLLIDIYAIVMLDNEHVEMDMVTISRIVRVNHPLARIVTLSNSRRSLFIADIINHGSVDAYLPLPADTNELLTILSEQQAKHDIDKMLTNFVSQPPKMSGASYLLLDPSLTASEDEPVKFVGIMIAYKSVPRYSRYFEDLLAKDEILFAGYLSGITMLGQELLKSEDPLKEINFGGISVIFRFDDEIQFSIFVRNLSKHNVEEAEEVISDILGDLLEQTGDEIASTDRPTNESLDLMDDITGKFETANEKVIYKKELESHATTHKGQIVLLYGTDAEEQEKIDNYLSSKVDYKIIRTTDEEEAKSMIKDYHVSVLILDSDVKNREGQPPLAFAEFLKDEYPFTQVIYQMRDRRAATPIIRSLNSGVINFLISYRVTRKELNDWIGQAIDKAIQIREQSKSAEMSGGIHTALAAKTKIRQNEQSYLTDSVPVMVGIFIANEEFPIFKRFWRETEIQMDDQMLAGLVASLDSVGEEMFYDDSTIGGIELGDSNLVVEHRDQLNFVFFIQNISSQNVEIIKKKLRDYSDRLFIPLSETDNYDDEILQSTLDTKVNNIYSEFYDEFSIELT